MLTIKKMINYIFSNVYIATLYERVPTVLVIL